MKKRILIKLPDDSPYILFNRLPLPSQRLIKLKFCNEFPVVFRNTKGRGPDGLIIQLSNLLLFD